MKEKNNKTKREQQSRSSENRDLKNVNPSENQQEILERARVPEEGLAGSGRSEGARPERVDKEIKFLPDKRKPSKDSR